MALKFSCVSDNLQNWSPIFLKKINLTAIPLILIWNMVNRTQPKIQLDNEAQEDTKKGHSILCLFISVVCVLWVLISS